MDAWHVRLAIADPNPDRHAATLATIADRITGGDLSDRLGDLPAADIIAAATGTLTDAGYRVTTDQQLQVFSPVPAGAPATVNALAELIDPTVAQRTVARLIAILGAVDAWDGEQLEAIERELRVACPEQSAPSIGDRNPLVTAYWERLAS